jgi:hypothetical protein
VRLQPLGHLSGESAGYADQLQKSTHALEDSAMGFNDFIRERRYLNNVSASTISWYTHALKWLPNESPSQDELKEVVLKMREKGLKATGCNAASCFRCSRLSTFFGFVEVWPPSHDCVMVALANTRRNRGRTAHSEKGQSSTVAKGENRAIPPAIYRIEGDVVPRGLNIGGTEVVKKCKSGH